MAQTQVIERTTEEITALLQAGAFAGQKLRVIVEPEEEDFSDILPDPPTSIRDGAHLEQLLLEGMKRKDYNGRFPVYLRSRDLTSVSFSTSSAFKKSFR